MFVYQLEERRLRHRKEAQEIRLVGFISAVYPDLPWIWLWLSDIIENQPSQELKQLKRAGLVKLWVGYDVCEKVEVEDLQLEIERQGCLNLLD